MGREESRGSLPGSSTDVHLAGSGTRPPALRVHGSLADGTMKVPFAISIDIRQIDQGRAHLLCCQS